MSAPSWIRPASSAPVPVSHAANRATAPKAGLGMRWSAAGRVEAGGCAEGSAAAELAAGPAMRQCGAASLQNQWSHGFNSLVRKVWEGGYGTDSEAVREGG